MSYRANDFGTGGNIFSYDATGWMGNVSSSLKFGSYRRSIPGLSDTSTMFGDWTMQKVAASTPN